MDSTPEQQAKGSAVVRVLAAVLDRLVIANAHLSSNAQITKFHALKSPSIGVLQYLERIYKYSSCSAECFILALVYIDRLIQRNNFLLTQLNVHRVVISSVLVAAKFFDDAYYNNAYYAKVGGVMVAELNSLEVEFLFRINFALHVSSEVYNKYSAELISHAAEFPPLVDNLSTLGNVACAGPAVVQACQRGFGQHQSPIAIVTTPADRVTEYDRMSGRNSGAFPSGAEAYTPHLSGDAAYAVSHQSQVAACRPYFGEDLAAFTVSQHHDRRIISPPPGLSPTAHLMVGHFPASTTHGVQMMPSDHFFHQQQQQEQCVNAAKENCSMVQSCDVSNLALQLQSHRLLHNESPSMANTAAAYAPSASSTSASDSEDYDSYNRCLNSLYAQRETACHNARNLKHAMNGSMRGSLGGVGTVPGANHGRSNSIIHEGYMTGAHGRASYVPPQYKVSESVYITGRGVA